jgi:hypothetical protein
MYLIANGEIQSKKKKKKLDYRTFHRTHPYTPEFLKGRIMDEGCWWGFGTYEGGKRETSAGVLSDHYLLFPCLGICGAPQEQLVN